MKEVVNSVLSYNYSRGEYPTDFTQIPAIADKVAAGYTLDSLTVTPLTPIGSNNYVSVTATMTAPA